MNCCDANGTCQQGHQCAARMAPASECGAAHAWPAGPGAAATHSAASAAARQPGGYPWDDITPAGDALADEIEDDLADAALGLLMTLLLVSATAFACGFVFARLFG